tara:strand:- start:273 stop:503 length:231 start_codon:yes stop_codon:yes gene_type:complete
MENQDHEDEMATSHYRTAGHSLILLGSINCAVAAYSLVSGSKQAFIGFDMMLLFGVSFVAIGIWMRTYAIQDEQSD